MTNKKSIIRGVIFILVFALLFYIRDSLFPVVLALILFFVLNPLVVLLNKKRKRWHGLNINISIFLSFLLATVTISLFFRFIIPPLTAEFNRFSQNIPTYLNSTKNIFYDLQAWYTGHEIPTALQNVLVSGFENLAKTFINLTQSTAKNIVGVAGQFVKIIIVPILTFYLLKDKAKIRSGMLSLLPNEYRQKTEKILNKISQTLSSYVKGVLILCIVVGIFATIGLYLLGVKYALILGLIAGVTEAIPIVGPWIGALPAIMIALIIDPILAVKVAILFLVIQLLENSILVPKILGDHLRLHPAAIIIGILVLGSFLGAWGLFFAAPILAILNIVYQEVRS